MIRLYSLSYSPPITVWNSNDNDKILALKWCGIYFNDLKFEISEFNQGGKDKKKRKLNIEGKNSIKHFINEFYSISEKGIFKMWNITKSPNNAIYEVNLVEKCKFKKNSSGDSILSSAKIR